MITQSWPASPEGGREQHGRMRQAREGSSWPALPDPCLPQVLRPLSAPSSRFCNPRLLPSTSAWKHFVQVLRSTLNVSHLGQLNVLEFAPRFLNCSLQMFPYKVNQCHVPCVSLAIGKHTETLLSSISEHCVMTH